MHPNNVMGTMPRAAANAAESGNAITNIINTFLRGPVSYLFTGPKIPGREPACGRGEALFNFMQLVGGDFERGEFWRIMETLPFECN